MDEGKKVHYVKDRDHRFSVGDLVSHADVGPIEIKLKTWRMNDKAGQILSGSESEYGVLYPTYVLKDEIEGSATRGNLIVDVLCTNALKPWEQWNTDSLIEHIEVALESVAAMYPSEKVSVLSIVRAGTGYTIAVDANTRNVNVKTRISALGKTVIDTVALQQRRP